jgi:hypothetical protein
MAFVICAVFLTDLMRRRMSRVLGMKIIFCESLELDRAARFLA